MAQLVKNPPANAGDTRDVGLIPGSGRSPGEWNGNPLQYSCLENSMNRGAWLATVHRVTKSQTGLKRLSVRVHTHTHTHTCIFIPNWSSLMMGVDLCLFVSPIFDWLCNHTLCCKWAPLGLSYRCLPACLHLHLNFSQPSPIYHFNNEFKWPPQLK